MPNNHNLEAFIEATIEANVKWILAERDDLRSPIEKLFLWSDQGRLEVAGVLVAGGGNNSEIVHGDIPETTLPVHDEDDDLLEAFKEEHDLEDLDWGDYYELPECMYRMEMIGAAKEVAKRLRGEGIEFADDARIGILIEDEDYTEVEDFSGNMKQGLAALGPELGRAFLAIYYNDPSKKEHLLK